MASVLDIIRHYQQAIEKHPDDEQRVLRSIGKLHQLSVTVDHLQETGVGRTVNALRKEPGDVGHAARSLVNKWKHMVTMETMRQEAEATNHESSNANGNGHQDSDQGGNQRDHRDRQSDHHDRQSDHRSDHIDRQSDHRDKHSDHERSRNSSSHINGDHNSSKRKQHSSDDDDEPNMKRSKQQHTSESDDYEQKPDVKIKTEQQDSYSDESDIDSDDSQSDSSQEIQIKKEIKQEPQEHDSADRYHSKESSKKSHSDEYKSSHESSKYRSSEQSLRHDQSTSSKHEQSRSKHKDSHKYHEREKESSSDRQKSKDRHETSPEKRHKSNHKEQEADKSSKRHSSDKDRSSSSHKHSSSSDKHKSSHKHDTEDHKHKPDKHKSSHKHDTEDHKHKPDKHKSSSSSKPHKTVRSDDEHKSSSEKHRSKEISSKTPGSSSDKEKKKEKSNASKDKSSHNDRKHTSSSDSKSKSSKSKSSKAGDSSSGSETKNKSSSSNKSSKSSDKTKETVPKNKKSQGEDSDDGIGCESGASFAEALGMLSPAKPKKKSSNIKDVSSPAYSSSSEFGVASLLAPSTKLAPLPALEISALPEISPNYKPRPPPKLLPHFSDEEALSASISSKNQRTKVYSGNKMYGKLPSLYEMCVQVLQEHIDALEYTGGVPYDILKPVIDRATPQQLFLLEHYNPYLMEDTDHLWEAFCAKHFRKQKREEMETWREMYIRCQEEQEMRLRSLTQTIKIAQEAKKAPVKQTKMAYVDTVVKPPRNIARKQAIHGTGRLPAASPLARVPSLSTAPLVARPGSARPPAAPPASLNSLNRPKKAPLMQKALQFMRGRKR